VGKLQHRLSVLAGSRAALRDEITSFEAGLREMGFFQGQNLALEYHFADGQFDRFPALASRSGPPAGVGDCGL
jgi:hypothetical protein